MPGEVRINSMPGKPTLRVAKWIRTVPVVAACTHCGREFKVPITALHSEVQARENLTMQFANHKCVSGIEKPGKKS
jgi:hypothetical protein